MIRYLYYSFIINYIHVYLLAPYFIYIGYNGLAIKTEKTNPLEKHYKILVGLGVLTAVYHMKRLTEKSIWIMCLIFLALAFIEYSYIFSYHIPKNIYLTSKTKGLPSTKPSISLNTKNSRKTNNRKVNKGVKKESKKANKKSKFNLYNGS